MKQNLPQELWDELNKEEKIEFLSNIFVNFKKLNELVEIGELIGIGDFIEYLGEDMIGMQRMLIGEWVVRTEPLDIPEGYEVFKDRELIKALWKASKYKFKNRKL